MPYIGKNRADDIRQDRQDSTNVGDLTYEITEAVVDYMARKGLSYQAISDVRASLYGTLREFDRRVADPYEDSVRPSVPQPRMRHSDELRIDPFERLNEAWAARDLAIQRRADRAMLRDTYH